MYPAPRQVIGVANLLVRRKCLRSVLGYAHVDFFCASAEIGASPSAGEAQISFCSHAILICSDVYVSTLRWDLLLGRTKEGLNISSGDGAQRYLATELKGTWRRASEKRTLHQKHALRSSSSKNPCEQDSCKQRNWIGSSAETCASPATWRHLSFGKAQDTLMWTHPNTQSSNH